MKRLNIDWWDLRWRLGRAMGQLRWALYIGPYRFRHWFFQWRLDSEGDLALVVANRIALIKYKEHTIVKWVNGRSMKEAPKYLAN
jgi:hypothetical protein